MKVLCVRVQVEQIPPPAIKLLQDHFGEDLELEFVNPFTPEQLDELTSDPDVVAVYLQERPLPTIVVEKGEVPCTLLNPNGQLVRLVKVNAEFEPL